jgi:hypothetical protein
MSTSIALKAAIGVLMVDSIIELAFISSMVSWLHNTASGSFAIVMGDGSTFNLRGEPLHLLVNQGHTSNGAAGTAFVLIGVGGILTLWLRNRAGRFGHALYYFWVVCNVLALMLTIAALAYVFSVINQHRGQVIDLGLAESLKGAKYPLDDWTPQNWFSAFLDLHIADDSVRNDIASHYRVMRGWQYNLIPLFVVQLVETVLAVMDGLRWRKEVQYAGVAQAQGQEKFSTHL